MPKPAQSVPAAKNMASPIAARGVRLDASTPETRTNPVRTTAMPSTRRVVMRSPKTTAPSTMPITLMAVNGKTAAWLGGANCSAPNINRPKGVPASRATDNHTRQRVVNCAMSRQHAKAITGSIKTPATPKRSTVRSGEDKPWAMPQRANTVYSAPMLAATRPTAMPLANGVASVCPACRLDRVRVFMAASLRK